MKVRQGFVSNSSSSSFIIGIAKIEDEQKLEEYLKKNKIEKDSEDLIIETFNDIKKRRKEYDYFFSERQNALIVDAFSGAMVSIDTKALKDDDKILIYYFCGDEGDFCFCDDCDDLDYDIDIDFFDSPQIDVINMLSSAEEAGLNKNLSEWTLGAGRNG